ncbi:MULTISPECIES: sensor histidine kinase [unclassified Oceanispirochaeta]|uniref:sensor histidine kinase n=1 Tax=unclassified Oceanispirochaeta TaxID=2635722 RepID=UPI000E09B610|nr:MULTISPECIES: HAMP domain-containing sensor histidine kinase [unclassified Oceanispirochaeta]MBF9014532.1 HAMP domain-containing histidine kinase [Oceanispirochaeta sp. M2]NPD70788.1 HAMP domain-containing histidine kinase [Oceanispirochaeta sp. M1]RDG34070.1 sensor histidine kinase [Oceanispirochaeta sp. M1]
MKIKLKLVSLILLNSVGFLFAFIIYLSVTGLLRDIEWEKKELEILSEKSQAVRISGAEIFMDRPLEDSWYVLEIQMKNLEIHYVYLDRLSILPFLNPQIGKAIGTIESLETITFEQYAVLSTTYSDIKTLLSDSAVFDNILFSTLFNAPSFIEEVDWVRLRFLADEFRTNYAQLDYILDNSVRILNEELYLIETEISHIRKVGLLVTLFLAFIIIGVMLIITLSLSQKIARDMVQINSSLSQMLLSSEAVVIDIERNDELGDLARNIESIFNELILTRDHLIQSEKMASLGELVAGIAHEINTPVGIGVTASSHMIGQIDELNTLFINENLTQEQFSSYLKNLKDSSDIMLSNMEKAAGLIKGFKQIAVDQSYQEARCFMVLDYLKDLKKSLKPLYTKRRIKIRLECDETLEINSIPGMLSQIITNLVQNAVLHAFSVKEEGRIYISLKKGSDDLILSFRDTGHGMTKEIMDRVFDPFFTTRRGSGGGSGLGLHIVYNLVTQGLGGTISCDSVPGEGTEFIIHFRECLRRIDNY